MAKEERTLTIDQAKALLDRVTRHRSEIAIMIALTYGLRRSGLLGLPWSALDCDAGTLRLTHAVR